jgi:hypothetical protein
MSAIPLPVISRVSHLAELTVRVTDRLDRAAAQVEQTAAEAAPGHRRYLSQQLAQDFLAGRGRRLARQQAVRVRYRDGRNRSGRRARAGSRA